MATVAVPEDTQIVLENLIKTIENLKQKLLDEKFEENLHFVAEAFWKSYENACRVLSHESTKLSMAFNKPPYPSATDCEEITNGLQSAVTTLTDMCVEFPVISEGRALKTEVCKFSVVLLTAVHRLCISIKTSSSDMLSAVGRVWESCKSVDQLPRDNKQVVLRGLQDELSIVIDAKDELKDSIESETVDTGFNEMKPSPQNDTVPFPLSIWAGSDNLFVDRCLRMVEMYVVCLKRVIKEITEKSTALDCRLCVELDELCEDVKSSSEIVDNLVSSLYPPETISESFIHATELKEKILQVMTWLENSSLHNDRNQTFITLFRDACNACWEIVNERAGQN